MKAILTTISPVVSLEHFSNGTTMAFAQLLSLIGVALSLITLLAL